MGAFCNNGGGDRLVSRPKKHHYIPAFYTQRWSITESGEVCEFSRPYRTVVPKTVHPNGTGYMHMLYELRNFHEEEASQIEELFFKRVDNDAHNALCLMEREGTSANWTDDLRTAWSRFIMTLLLRCPEDLDLFRKGWEASSRDFIQREEPNYQRDRLPGDPPTLAALMDGQSPFRAELNLLQSYVRMNDNPRVGETIARMRWRVLDFPDADYDFLTSDRPVIRTNGITRHGGHIALPIGPRKLFLALDQTRTPLSAWTHKPTNGLLKEINRQVVSSAVRYVYGSSDQQLPFVRRHFSTVHQKRIAEHLVGH